MRFALFLFTFFLLNTLSAQSSGKISFEDRIDMHRNIPLEQEHYKNMMPQFNSSKWELIFNDNESTYLRIIEAELKGSSANQFGYRYGRENRTIYKDLAEEKMVDSRDFMQKQFLIKGFTKTHKWKIGKNQKEIMGYKCLEAYMQVDSITALKAWFTPQIAVSNGPSEYHGLPGMILQIDINDGERTVTATEIELEKIDPALIIIPVKGREITSHEFEKLREEKLKEISAQKNSGYYFMTRRYY